ncbi:peptidoglycan-binding domain-containing protein [Austwickia sp. TVS 96-490-7B]|uniref:peptidoglycan-binding domain-containing protein n=1 Tax=Austwickia sp. TVS 96-490-7B TaxID=2830843 RepID=UPI001C585E3A|nr:peptidoglycan-binding domain-containing protein [Austwickia sp. TVS 96-490-7B]
MTALITLVVVATVAAVVLAALGVIAADEQQGSPAPQARLTEKVTLGQVRQTVNGTATVTRQHRLELNVPASAEQGSVVTATRLRRGETYGAGSLLMAISDRPLIVLPGSFPMYRDLTPGSEGADVDQLQHGLQGLGYAIADPPGRYGTSTQQAVADLYRSLDHAPHGHPRTAKDVRVPRGEIVFSPALPLVVTDPCPDVGAAVAPGQPICALSAGAAALTAEIPAETVKDLPAHATVTIWTPGGDRRTGTVKDPSPAASNLTGTPGPGASKGSAPTATPAPRDRSDSERRAVELSGTIPTAWTDGRRLHAEFVLAQSPEKALVIPAGAVRDDHRVLVVGKDGDRVVDVTVGVCALGRCAITPRGDLTATDSVILVAP